jgi:hypothetical protein
MDMAFFLDRVPYSYFVMLALDLGVFHRKTHKVNLKKALSGAPSGFPWPCFSIWAFISLWAKFPPWNS